MEPERGQLMPLIIWTTLFKWNRWKCQQARQQVWDEEIAQDKVMSCWTARWRERSSQRTLRREQDGRRKPGVCPAKLKQGLFKKEGIVNYVKYSLGINNMRNNGKKRCSNLENTGTLVRPALVEYWKESQIGAGREVNGGREMKRVNKHLFQYILMGQSSGSLSLNSSKIPPCCNPW